MSAHLSAVDLLKLGDKDRQKPFLNVYWPYIVGCTLGFATGCGMNFATRRPSFSGIQKHVILMGGWSAFLNYVQNKRDDYFAERDAVYKHYIELHPDDFKEPERKKIGEIVEPWIPVR